MKLYVFIFESTGRVLIDQYFDLTVAEVIINTSIFQTMEKFRQSWEHQFPTEPIPDNLDFLQSSSDRVLLEESLAGCTRIIAKLQQEMNKQNFIAQFLLQLIDESSSCARPQSGAALVNIVHKASGLSRQAAVEAKEDRQTDKQTDREADKQTVEADYVLFDVLPQVQQNRMKRLSVLQYTSISVVLLPCRARRMTFN